MKHPDHARSTKLLLTCVLVSFWVSAFASDVSINQTPESGIEELKEILQVDSMVLTGNCFGDEATESKFGEYDKSSDEEHYGGFGNPRDEDPLPASSVLSWPQTK